MFKRFQEFEAKESESREVLENIQLDNTTELEYYDGKHYKTEEMTDAFECSLCKVILETIEDVEAHCQTPEHLAKEKNPPKEKKPKIRDPTKPTKKQLKQREINEAREKRDQKRSENKDKTVVKQAPTKTKEEKKAIRKARRDNEKTSK